MRITPSRRNTRFRWWVRPFRAGSSCKALYERYLMILTLFHRSSFLRTSWRNTICVHVFWADKNPLFLRAQEEKSKFCGYFQHCAAPTLFLLTPDGVRSVSDIHRGANAPRSLSHLPASLRNAENTHNFFTHPKSNKW